jgi:hypothetical protein
MCVFSAGVKKKEKSRNMRICVGLADIKIFAVDTERVN